MKISRRSLLFGTASTAILGSGLSFGQVLANAPIKIGTKPEDYRLLVRMIRVVYPHSQFPDGPYERTADTIIGKANSSAGQALMMAEGLRALSSHSFAAMDDASATAHLATLEGTSFFLTCAWHCNGCFVQ
jgi:hypothetical protein